MLCVNFFPGNAGNTKALLHNKHDACTFEDTSFFLCHGLRGQEPQSSKSAGGRLVHPASPLSACSKSALCLTSKFLQAWLSVTGLEVVKPDL